MKRNNRDVPAALVKAEIRERLTPIVERMGGDWEQQKANAHLIAAAPQMYEALLAYQQANRLHNDAEAALYDQAEKALNAADGKVQL